MSEGSDEAQADAGERLLLQMLTMMRRKERERGKEATLAALLLQSRDTVN